MFNLLPRMMFLQEDEQLHIQAMTKRWVVNGPGRCTIWPMWRYEKKVGVTLGPTEYMRVRNKLTGKIRNEHGPKLFMPGVNDEILEEMNLLALKHNEYIRLKDTETGVVRTEKGECQVYLKPTEVFMDPKSKVQSGINIDDKTAVLIRDTKSGQLGLVTDKQVFVPQPHQELVEVRKRISLEEHEAVIIKDKNGRFEFRKGTDDERSFFLEPHCTLVALRWSTGLHKEHRDLTINKIDLRPKYMWYEFEARTKDNVDLVIGITCFWEVSNVSDMIMTTDDAPGDLCSHARSAILQKVSRVTLEEFLAGFNDIVNGAMKDQGDEFCQKRGISLHSVEVRSIECGDEDTQHVLQEIINETTQRINRMQKQESENEVQIQQMQGQIETEQRRAELLEMKRNNARTEGLLTGESEALRVSSFLEGLGENLSSKEKLMIFDTLRRKEIYSDLSKGSAQLFLVPEDADLHVKTK